MRRTLAGWMTVVLLVAAAPVAAQTSLRMTVTRNGAPAPKVEFALQLAGEPQRAIGATGADGIVDLALGAVNNGKPLRVQVVVYDCPNDQHLVVFVAAGAKMPEDKDCRRSALLWIFLNRHRVATLDVGTRVLRVQQSFIATTGGKIALAAGGAAAAGLALASGGGGSNAATPPVTNNPPVTQPPPSNPPFNAAGNYVVTNSLGSDPGNVRNMINMEATTVLNFVFEGTNGIRIVCPPGSKYTLLTGTFVMNDATGEKRITAQGKDQNGTHVFEITMQTTGATPGRFTGTHRLGAGGELPGGQPIVFNVNGQKQ